MRRLMAGVLGSAALVAGTVAGPAAAAPSENACHERPSGAHHGTQQAHGSIPEGRPGHHHVRHYCGEHS